MRAFFYFPGAVVVWLLFVPGSWADASHRNVSGLAEMRDGFFELFERNTELSQARSKCMAGEIFHQSYAGRSHIRQVSRMSNGYFYGMMLSYASNVCELNPDTASGKTPNYSAVLGKLPDASSSGDTLRHYPRDNNRSPVALPEADPLIQNYSLLLPLGMIESSGNYLEGRDRSAANFSAATAEAGLFQVSANSMNLGGGVMGEIYSELMTKYANGRSPKCITGVFGIQQRVEKQVQNWGAGIGLEFQRVMKDCPAMAVDYMAALLRVNHNHNGPLDRKEAQPRAACVKVLEGVRDFITGNGRCSGLDLLAGSFPADQRANRGINVAPPEDRGIAMERSTGSLARAADEARDAADQLEKLKETQGIKGNEETEKALQEEISGLKKSAEAIDKDITVQRNEIENLRGRIEVAKKQLKQEETNIEQWQEEAQDLRAKATREKNPEKRAQLEAEAEKKEKLVKESKASAEALKLEIKRMEDEIKEREAKIVQLKADRDKQIASLKERIPGLKNVLETLKKEFAELEAQLKASPDDERLKAKLEEKTSALEKAKSNFEAAEAELKRLEADKTRNP